MLGPIEKPAAAVGEAEAAQAEAMTSPIPSECQSECINFLIFLVHLILFIVNKLYVECKLMFIFICSFNYLMYILIII